MKELNFSELVKTINRYHDRNASFKEHYNTFIESLIKVNEGHPGITSLIGVKIECMENGTLSVSYLGNTFEIRYSFSLTNNTSRGKIGFYKLNPYKKDSRKLVDKIFFDGQGQTTARSVSGEYIHISAVAQEASLIGSTSILAAWLIKGLADTTDSNLD